MNLLSACKVGALLLMGSKVIYGKSVTFEQVFAVQMIGFIIFHAFFFCVCVSRNNNQNIK